MDLRTRTEGDIWFDDPRRLNLVRYSHCCDAHLNHGWRARLAGGRSKFGRKEMNGTTVYSCTYNKQKQPSRDWAYRSYVVLKMYRNVQKKIGLDRSMTGTEPDDSCRLVLKYA